MSTRLNSREDLLHFYEQVKHIAQGKTEEVNIEKRTISVCSCTGCASQDSLLIVDELNRIIAERHLENHMHAENTGCF